MEANPKIQIKLTVFDKGLEIGAIILLMIIWILAPFNYFISLDTVPIHFNLSGKPDGCGSKVAMLLLPVIPTIIYLVLTLLNEYPHFYNYITKITVKNAMRQYTIATRMIRILKLSVMFIFIIDSLCTLLITLGIVGGLGKWNIQFTILILAVPTIYAVFQLLNKNENVG